jgi:hypothetical protein
VLIGAVAAVVGVSALFGLRNLPDGDGEPDGSGGTTAAAVLGEQPPDVDDKIFDDKFGQEDSGWPRTGDGAYRDRSYGIRLVPSLGHTTVAAPVRSVPDAQLMEVKVRLGGPDAEAGVFCRSAGGTGYAFLVRGSGQARIAWMAPDKLEDLHTGFVTTLRKDRDNRVQAACVPDDAGMRLGLWVNGEAVATGTDHEHPDEFGEPGKSGLIVARAGDPSAEQRATFDNFSLCSV